MGITAACTDGNVKDVDARVLKSLEIGCGKAVRI